MVFTLFAVGDADTDTDRQTQDKQTNQTDKTATGSRTNMLATVDTRPYLFLVSKNHHPLL